ncbi:hypothetical protein HDU91_003271 [Kappamyces sp. JEL0680]|nr:hypothetical protein HDU91_003271 [Kappamyces sp. JEL0680]
MVLDVPMAWTGTSIVWSGASLGLSLYSAVWIEKSLFPPHIKRIMIVSQIFNMAIQTMFVASVWGAISDATSELPNTVWTQLNHFVWNVGIPVIMLLVLMIDVEVLAVFSVLLPWFSSKIKLLKTSLISMHSLMFFPIYLWYVYFAVGAPIPAWVSWSRSYLYSVAACVFVLLDNFSYIFLIMAIAKERTISKSKIPNMHIIIGLISLIVFMDIACLAIGFLKPMIESGLPSCSIFTWIVPFIGFHSSLLCYSFYHLKIIALSTGMSDITSSQVFSSVIISRSLIQTDEVENQTAKGTVPPINSPLDNNKPLPLVHLPLDQFGASKFQVSPPTSAQNESMRITPGSSTEPGTGRQRAIHQTSGSLRTDPSSTSSRDGSITPSSKKTSRVGNTSTSSSSHSRATSASAIGPQSPRSRLGSVQETPQG